MTPTWLLDAFAALMLTVAALSAARIVASRPWRHRAVVLDTDVAHLLMAIAMAGMLTATLQTLPETAWAAVFVLLTAWFAVRVARDARATGIRALADGHRAAHLVHSGAMLYMFLALAAPGITTGGITTGGITTGGGMAGMSAPASSSMPTLEYATLTFALGLMLAGYAVWDLDQLSAGRSRAAALARHALVGHALVGPALNSTSLTVTVLTGAPLTAPAPTGSARISSPRVHVTPAASAMADQAAPATQQNHEPAVPKPTTQRPAAPGSEIPGRAKPTPAQPPPGATRELLLSAGVTVGCRIAMGVTMALMLFVMI